MSRDAINPRPDRLVPFFHHRWTCPVLAELARTNGSKFVTLARRLGISPNGLRRTLEHAIEHGWIERNPGYGHPMRPEYVPTPTGASVGAVWGELATAITDAEVLDMLRLKWSIPILASVATGAERFGQIRNALPGATDRAIASGLRALCDRALLERHVHADHPPIVRYRPSDVPGLASAIRRFWGTVEADEAL